MVIKVKRLYSCFNIWKKQLNIAVLENKKFGKGCFKPSEHISYLIFVPFPNPTMVGGIITHSFSISCPGFLINQVGMSIFGWLWSKMGVTF